MAEKVAQLRGNHEEGMTGGTDDVNEGEREGWRLKDINENSDVLTQKWERTAKRKWTKEAAELETERKDREKYDFNLS